MQVAIATPIAFSVRPPAPGTTRPALRDVARQSTSCLGCGLRKICMPVDVDDAHAKALFEQLVTTRIRLRKGDVLFRAGDRFTALYAIRLGSCKTVMLSCRSSVSSASRARTCRSSAGSIGCCRALSRANARRR